MRPLMAVIALLAAACSVPLEPPPVDDPPPSDAPALAASALETSADIEGGILALVECRDAHTSCVSYCGSIVDTYGDCLEACGADFEDCAGDVLEECGG